MNEPQIDPTVLRLRGEISDVDRAILAVVNTRIELVAQLKRHKDEVGLPFLDPDRERRLIEELDEKNAGPLSAEGLEELYTYLLDLTKREVGKDGGPN
jgi:3-deoxy-7-phosphoheptulonate synthase/chorismate mutase